MSLHLFLSTLFSLLDGFSFTQHRETLVIVENAKLSVKVFSAIHVYGHELSTLPVDVVPSYFQQQQSLSVRARESFFFTTLSSYFLSSTNNEIVIINSSPCPDFSSTFADEGEWVVVIVVQFLQHVYKTNALSNSHACFGRAHRCCCRN